MAKHTGKVNPLVSSLVAWQDARALMFAVRELIKAGRPSKAAAELLMLAEKFPDVIERGHLRPSRAEEIAAYWEAESLAESMQRKLRSAIGSGAIEEETAERLSISALIERAAESIRSLIRMTA